jgi:hypothetical protein
MNPVKPQSERWPVTVTVAGAAYVTPLPAPSNSMSHYVTGLNASAASTVRFPRRQCVLFNEAAAADFITTGDAAGVQIADAKDFIILFWFKAASGQVSTGDFVSKINGTNGYTVEIDANGKLKVSIGDADTEATITSTRAVNDGNWHHVAIYFEYNLATGLNLFIDGVATGTPATTVGIAGVGTGAAGLILGGGSTSATKTIHMSQFGIYVNADLSTTYAAIITAHYNKEGGRVIGKKFVGTETNLQVAYNLDEGTSTVTTDLVGALDGTAEATVTWVNDGAPFEVFSDNTKEPLPEVQARNGAAISDIFPHPIKIGRNAPLHVNISAAATVTFFGFTDGV